jgi:small-conductance mechanosensitive channel
MDTSVQPRLVALLKAAKQDFNDAVVAIDAASDIAAEARDVAEFANDAIANNEPGAADHVATAARLADEAFDAVNAALDAISSVTHPLRLMRRAFEIAEELEPATATAESPTVDAGPAIMAALEATWNDNSTQPSQASEETQEPIKMHRLILGVVIAAMLAVAFWRINQEAFMFTVLMFVLTVLVPLYWSYRVCTWFVASCETVAAMCVLLLVVGCVLRS